MPPILHLLLSVMLFTLTSENLHAQKCTYKDSALYLHFGTTTYPEDIRMNFLNQYKYADENCPDDGNYAYRDQTESCFNGDWHNIQEDHTAGDKEGRFLLVNAAHKPGPFFISYAGALEPEKPYEFSVWMMNICQTNSGCRPHNPNITISIESDDGKILAQYNTGDLPRSDQPKWTRFSGFFRTGAAAGKLMLIMTDNNPGGCGNDFVLDDIVIRKCIPLIEESKPDPPLAKPITEKPPVKIQDEKKLVKKSASPVQLKPAQSEVTRNLPSNMPVKQKGSKSPLPLINRANPVVSQIKTKSGQILIELYDNGQIDGDTVSIYHNQVLVASKVGLSAKPFQIQIAVNQDNPHHELVMVAENLGSIPPNTSLMIVTGPKLRKEIFISSTEETNAKILINLESD